MRARLMLFGVSFLAAACAPTGGSTPARQSGSEPTAAASDIDVSAMTPEYVAALPPDQATSTILSMMDRYIALAFAPCPDRSDACLDKQVAGAFDPTGQSAPLCRIHGGGKEYQLCLMAAAQAVPMVTAAGGNPATDINWSDFDNSDREGKKLLIDVVLKQCGEQKPCIVEQMSSLLGQPPAVAKSCQKHQPFNKQLDCVYNVLVAGVYRQAITILSAQAG